MKVSIEHSEVKKGLIFKTTVYQILVDLQFTEEEKHIMKKYDIRECLVSGSDYTKPDGGPIANLFASEGQKKCILYSANAAKYADADIKEGLTRLKARIDECSEGTGSTTFEL